MTVNSMQVQLIHCSGMEKSSNERFDFSFIYGLNTIARKRYLWNGLIDIQGIDVPWLVTGKVNTPFDIDRRKNGANVTLHEIDGANASKL